MSESVRPLRIALLGSGAWARVLATAARASARLDLVGCWSRTPSRLHEFAAATGVAACTDLDRLLHDPDVDAVIIALPNDRHREYASRAAAHGKHVFVEKPIAHTLADGLAMVELERTHGIRLAVGHCARMLTGNQLLAQAVRDGELGRVTHIEAKFANNRGLKLTPQDWRWYQLSAPGGPLSQIAIHQFDTLRAIGGDLRCVSARSARLSPVGAEVEDQWMVGIDFVDGKLGNVVASWTSPGVYSVRVTGDRASLSYEVDQALWSQPERLHEHAVLERQDPDQGPGTRVRLPVPAGNMFRDELELFAECVLRDTACELSGENACHALAAVDAAIASAQRAGEAVHLEEMMLAARGAMTRAGAPSRGDAFAEPGAQPLR